MWQILYAYAADIWRRRQLCGKRNNFKKSICARHLSWRRSQRKWSIKRWSIALSALVPCGHLDSDKSAFSAPSFNSICVLEQFRWRFAFCRFRNGLCARPSGSSRRSFRSLDQWNHLIGGTLLRNAQRPFKPHKNSFPRSATSMHWMSMMFVLACLRMINFTNWPFSMCLYSLISAWRVQFSTGNILNKTQVLKNKFECKRCRIVFVVVIVVVVVVIDCTTQQCWSRALIVANILADYSR